MNEMVLNTSILPEPIFSLIHAEKMSVKEVNGGVYLMPVTNRKKGCPLRGMCADGKLSSYSFMERKQAEKELEL